MLHSLPSNLKGDCLSDFAINEKIWFNYYWFQTLRIRLRILGNGWNVVFDWFNPMNEKGFFELKLYGPSLSF